MLFLLGLGKLFTFEAQGQVLRRVINPYSLCRILWLAREG